MRLYLDIALLFMASVILYTGFVLSASQNFSTKLKSKYLITIGSVILVGVSIDIFVLIEFW